MKTIMECNFILLKLNMPNENILFSKKVNKNELNRGENNAYFDTSLETTPKNDEPIATRMMQLPRLPTLIINLGFIQT